MLALHALRIGYGARTLATLPDTTVAPGEFVSLLGRNGQGKSTLLRTLGGFIPPVGGEVTLEGRAIRTYGGAERARRVAVVLTDRPQVPGLSVTDLVQMGRQPHTGWAGRLTEADRRIAAEALALVGGEHLAGRLLDSLSDGERQRAMIARALAQQPALMLLDEITAFLDLPSRITLTDTLRRIAREQGVAIIVSSHDLELSLQTADRLWLLPGDGRCVDGVPEDVALSGAIGAAFDQHDLTFSLVSGRFETHMPGGRRLHVGKGGIETDWLVRALQRTGCMVVDAAEDAEHRIVRDAEGWRIDGGPPQAHIADVLRALCVPGAGGGATC